MLYKVCLWWLLASIAAAALYGSEADYCQFDPITISGEDLRIAELDAVTYRAVRQGDGVLVTRTARSYPTWSSTWGNIKKEAGRRLRSDCSGKLVFHDSEHSVSNGDLRIFFEVTCHKNKCKSNPHVKFRVHPDLVTQLVDGRPVLKGVTLSITNPDISNRKSRCNFSLPWDWGPNIFSLGFQQMSFAALNIGLNFASWSIDASTSRKIFEDVLPKDTRFEDPSVLVIESEGTLSCVNTAAGWAILSEIKTQGEMIGDRSIPYTVARGDTLWAIAERYYGSARYHIFISSTNGLDPGGQSLVSGQDIVLTPFRAFAGASENAVVRGGETLSGIATSRGAAYSALYRSNRDVIGGDPNLIYPMQALKLPRQQ